MSLILHLSQSVYPAIGFKNLISPASIFHLSVYFLSLIKIIIIHLYMSSVLFKTSAFSFKYFWELNHFKLAKRPPQFQLFHNAHTESFRSTSQYTSHIYAHNSCFQAHRPSKDPPSYFDGVLRTKSTLQNSNVAMFLVTTSTIMRKSFYFLSISLYGIIAVE